MAIEINMPTPQGGKIAGLFRSPAAVERALNAAEQLGYSRDNIHLVTKDEPKPRAADETPAAHVRGDVPGEGPWRGATVGAVIGAVLGAMAGLFLTVFSVIFVNPILTALVVAALGAATGLYFGSLLGVSLPEGREKQAEEAVASGAVLLSVSPRSEADAERLKNEWGRLGAEVLAE